MLFHKIDYIIFLALAVSGYWALLRWNLLRVTFLVLASSIFYMAWNPAYIGLILFSVLLDYVSGLSIARSETRSKKKAWLIVSLVGNLGLLGTFKYFNFFMSATSDVLNIFGLSFLAPHLNVLLPVGISFYTFQTMSYSIDIYRGRLEPSKNILEFAFYVTFFPQLVAGPIVRAVQFLPQLRKKPRLTLDQVSDGVFLIATGLVKKIVVADYLAVNLIDRVFDNPAAFTSTETVLALYAYTMQIYCDFSGYTDIARGSAKLFGLEIPENFNRPYVATSPADFWRRWHMTLSTWLRDYLYYPLGGSKKGNARTYINLWLTMFLIGMWHGASWNFVIYANLHAFAMVIHRFFYKRSGRTRNTVDPLALKALKIFGTLNFVVFARILFRAPDVKNAWTVTQQMFVGSTSVAQISTGVWIILLTSFGVHYLPRDWFERLRMYYLRAPAVAQGVAVSCVAAGLSLMATSDVVPYIYYQF